jgi:hypothetical protein
MKRTSTSRREVVSLVKSTDFRAVVEQQVQLALRPAFSKSLREVYDR